MNIDGLKEGCWELKKQVVSSASRDTGRLPSPESSCTTSATYLARILGHLNSRPLPRPSFIRCWNDAANDESDRVAVGCLGNVLYHRVFVPR